MQDNLSKNVVFNMDDLHHQAGIMLVRCTQLFLCATSNHEILTPSIHVGSRRSVGIFIWTTNSEMDNRISGGPWVNDNNNASFGLLNTSGLIEYD